MRLLAAFAAGYLIGYHMPVVRIRVHRYQPQHSDITPEEFDALWDWTEGDE